MQFLQIKTCNKYNSHPKIWKFIDKIKSVLSSQDNTPTTNRPRLYKV